MLYCGKAYSFAFPVVSKCSNLSNIQHNKVKSHVFQLGLSEALDYTEHDGLMYKLKALGISESVLSIVWV